MPLSITYEMDQVDHWVKPYIRLMVERLRRTEQPLLKCLLIQVIADVLYCNTSFRREQTSWDSDEFHLKTSRSDSVKDVNPHIHKLTKRSKVLTNISRPSVC